MGKQKSKTVYLVMRTYKFKDLKRLWIEFKTPKDWPKRFMGVFDTLAQAEAWAEWQTIVLLSVE